jgi:amino acid transporter
LKTERELGLFSAVMMGLSGAIGFEIFVLLDYAYRLTESGLALMIVLVLAGVLNLIIMFSYCELSAAMPEVGGEYTYIKTAYGGYIAFIAGCFRWLASIFGAALAATTFTLQMAYFFSVVSPQIQSFFVSQIPLISVIIVACFAALEVKGVKHVGSLIVFVFLAVFAVFIAGGMLHGLTDIGVLPKPMLESLSGIFASTVYVFPIFFGMRALVAGAAMVKRPGKNIPRGIMLSALIIIPIYACLAVTASGVVSPGEVQPSVPFLNFAAQKIMGDWGGALFAVAGMVASLSALGTSLAVQSNILRGMSRDGYLPKTLLSVHRSFGTPYLAIVAGSLFVMFFSALGVVVFLGYAASFGSLLVFALVNLSVLKLRKEKPHIERPFKTPLYPFTPIIGFTLPMVLLVFPVLLRDTNAVEAIISSLGLTGLVLVTYYLRMVGRRRLQIAVGGIGVGTGVSLVLLTFLLELGLISQMLFYVPSYVMLVVGAVFIIGGILNILSRD